MNRIFAFGNFSTPPPPPPRPKNNGPPLASKFRPVLSRDQALLLFSLVKRFPAGKVSRSYITSLCTNVPPPREISGKETSVNR